MVNRLLKLEIREFSEGSYLIYLAALVMEKISGSIENTLIHCEIFRSNLIDTLIILRYKLRLMLTHWPILGLVSSHTALIRTPVPGGCPPMSYSLGAAAKDLEPLTWLILSIVHLVMIVQASTLLDNSGTRMNSTAKKGTVQQACRMTFENCIGCRIVTFPWF